MSAYLGERLNRYRRYAGLTQRELAQRSGISLSLIRLIEQGGQTTTRHATAHALARALSITTTALIEEHVDTPSPMAGGQDSRWAQIHRAVSDQSVDQDAEVPTTVGVQDGLTSAARAYACGDYAQLATTLPLLIADARAVAELDQSRGPGILATVLTMTARQMIQTRQYSVAEAALDQALTVAPDQGQHITAVTTRCWLYLRRGRLAESQALAEHWADEVEPKMSRATPAQLAAWGWMTIRAGAAAARDGRPDDAERALRSAAAAAAMLPRPVRLSVASHQLFGPALVGTQRVEYAMLQDRPDEALRLAVELDRSGQRTNANTHRRHLVTKAQAQARLRRYVDATDTLMGVDADAPQWLAYQQSARDVVELITSKRRTLSPEMRHLAQRVKLA